MPSELVDHILGYGFFDRQWPTSPGYEKLRVTLRAEPGSGYYSPEYLRVSIIHAQQIEHLTISHPWGENETCQVGMDRIVLRDHEGLTIEAFTFGGRLQIMDKGESTLCVLSSPAPILELSEESSTANMLVAEAELILANYRADIHSKPFESWLAAANPLRLYAAILQMIKHRLLAVESPDVTQVQMLRIVSAEIAALLADHFNSGLPGLDEVLSQPE